MNKAGIKVGNFNYLFNITRNWRSILPIFFLTLLGFFTYNKTKSNTIPTSTPGDPGVVSAVDKTVNLTKDALKTVMNLRITMTIFLIAWLAVMTYYMAFKYDKESIFDFWKSKEQKESEKTKADSEKEAKKTKTKAVDPATMLPYDGIRKTDKPTRLFYLHRIWFGDESVVYMLFKMWFMAVMFMVATPIIKEVLVNLKLLNPQ